MDAVNIVDVGRKNMSVFVRPTVISVIFNFVGSWRRGIELGGQKIYKKLTIKP
jgi:hypothetical protein